MPFLPKLTSAAKMQREYKKVLDTVKETREPVVILRRNKPEAAIIDIETFEELSQKAANFDELKAIEAISESEAEYKAGKAKRLTSLDALLDED